jgi:cyclopropane-fatty-acyl-phospholipid synthase
MQRRRVAPPTIPLTAIWRLYMAGAAHGFRSGRLNVYETLLAKPLHGQNGLPLTRDDWYRV